MEKHVANKELEMNGKLYEEYRGKIGTAVIWIAVYLVGLPISNKISELVGISSLVVMIYRVLFVLALLAYIKKQEAFKYYGFSSIKNLDAKAMLYYIPFILIVFVPFCFGLEISMPWRQLLLQSAEALCIGFIEEVLMRGFLFKALLKKGKVRAIIISSCAFGLVHIVNLFGGADVLYTLIQIIFACVFGFTCAVFFYKTNNLIPCIICHGALDLSALFWVEDENELLIILGLQGIICMVYGIYLLRIKLETSENTI